MSMESKVLLSIIIAFFTDFFQKINYSSFKPTILTHLSMTHSKGNGHGPLLLLIVSDSVRNRLTRFTQEITARDIRLEVCEIAAWFLGAFLLLRGDVGLVQVFVVIVALTIVSLKEIRNGAQRRDG